MFIKKRKNRQVLVAPSPDLVTVLSLWGEKGRSYPNRSFCDSLFWMA